MCDSELMTPKEEKAQYSSIFCSFDNYIFQISLIQPIHAVTTKEEDTYCQKKKDHAYCNNTASKQPDSAFQVLHEWLVHTSSGSERVIKV